MSGIFEVVFIMEVIFKIEVVFILFEVAFIFKLIFIFEVILIFEDIFIFEVVFNTYNNHNLAVFASYKISNQLHCKLELWFGWVWMKCR